MVRRRVEAGSPRSQAYSPAGDRYAWRRRRHSRSDREPVAIFTGEAVHAYLGRLPDAQIEAMLNELAGELGAALGQERLYVAFCDKTWILDCGEDSRNPPAAGRLFYQRRCKPEGLMVSFIITRAHVLSRRISRLNGSANLTRPRRSSSATRNI
ncbi:MAG: hypothetical protein U1E25_01175 [Methylocystis sp.]